MAELLRLSHVTRHFHPRPSFTIPAVTDVSLTLHTGEILGLAGESGSGKSTLARLITGLDSLTSGEIYYKNTLLSAQLPHPLRQDFRRSVQIIFQDAASSLNPRMTIRQIIEEPMRIHHLYHSQTEYTRKVDELLEQVGLENRFSYCLPDELSGGQRQRVNIARCLGLQPKLILADEPTASLDVSMQAQIINLFRQLQQQQHFAFLFITHDLSLLRVISDRIAVMYAGRLVELAPVEALFNAPQHPYTQALLSAIPHPDPVYEHQRTVTIYPGLPAQKDFHWHEKKHGHFVLE